MNQFNVADHRKAHRINPQATLSYLNFGMSLTALTHQKTKNGVKSTADSTTGEHIEYETITAPEYPGCRIHLSLCSSTGAVRATYTRDPKVDLEKSIENFLPYRALLIDDIKQVITSHNQFKKKNDPRSQSDNKSTLNHIA